MPVTRIKNNQITDSSSGNVYLGVNAAAKVQDFSVTAGKLANNLTYGSNLTITGNLTVQGETTTIDTTNLAVEDPLILLAKEQTGSPTLDIGFIGKRGTSDNIAFVWDESADEFITAFTSSETTNTVITVSSYASLKTLDLAVTGNANVTGFVSATGNVTGGNINTAGLVTATGNVTGGNILTAGDVNTGTLHTSGNALIGGNLIVQGNITYINIDDLRVEDPIIVLGTGPNGAPLSSDDGKDRGIYMEWYKTGLGNAFMGWDNSTGNMVVASNTTISSDVITVVEYGTLQAGNAYLQTASVTGTVVADSQIKGQTLHVTGVANVAGTLQIGANTVTTNAAIAVNTTNSILIPVGNTAQRPGTSVTGMVRFNTSIDSLEFYDSDSWTSAGTTFTVIVADAFTGDGSTVGFTLSEDSTTAGTIVSINGVVQIPTTAYSVAGNVLTFTEAPTVSDVIDARILTTSQTVTGIQNTSGNAVFEGSTSSAAFIVTGNLIPSANVTYNLGSNAARWNDAFFNGTTITLGNVQIKNETGTNVGFFGPDGTTPATTDLGGLVANGNINIQNGGSNIHLPTLNGNVHFAVNSVNIMRITSDGIVNDLGNGVGNIGNSTAYFNTVFAQATSAQYADLAEMYEADSMIEPGTVVCFGGTKEVTTCAEDGSRRVAGVVSTNPSYIMNAGLQGDCVVAVALTGRVPTRVTGTIRKGDMLVSAGDGRARAEANPAVGAVIGKSLADFDGADGVIEVVVGRV